MSQKVRVRIGERWHEVEVGDLDGNPISVVVDGVRVEVDTQLIGRSLGLSGVDASSGPAAADSFASRTSFASSPTDSRTPADAAAETGGGRTDSRSGGLRLSKRSDRRCQA